MITKTLWIKDEYLEWILSGRKRIEVRVAYSNIARLQPGDQVMLNDRYLFGIQRVGRYVNFDELVAHEDPQAIAPGLPTTELLSALRSIYPPEKENLGVVALEISSLT
jgi:ASC-1-like (ASCH) protein